MPSTAPVPGDRSRWRCTVCGNLTRFDVTRTTRAREYVHVELAGAPVVEERTVLEDTVESVRCRWCDAVDTVELVDRLDAAAAQAAGGSADPATSPAGDALA